MSYSDSTTGKIIPGKAYVLKTTEGEELVDPARLFSGDANGDGVNEWQQAMEERVAGIEEALGLNTEPAPAADDEPPAPVQEA